MGKLTALIIIVFTAVWLGPMCVQLPLMGATPPRVVAVPEPAPIVAPVPAPVAAPALPEKQVTVSVYRMRKMFPIVDGHGQISVLIKNHSDRAAIGMRLTMAASLQGQSVERDSVKTAFSVAPAGSIYRGLLVSISALDAILAAPPEEGAELQWVLTYRLEGDAPELQRCFTLRAAPRPLEPEGITWRPLGESQDCPLADSAR